VYVGEIVHKGQHYPGEHEPILDKTLFEAVQEKLASWSRAYRQFRVNNGSLLRGLIFDNRGNRMTPSSAKKGSVRYRYYVSAPLIQGRREDAGSVSRVPAPDVEEVVLESLKEHLRRTCAPENSGERIAKGRLWVDELISGRVSDTKEIAGREGCSDRSIRMTLSLAFLSPRIVQAAVDGTLPDGPGVSRLTELPPAWPKQAESITA